MYPAHFYEPHNGVQPGMKPPPSLPAGAFPEPDGPRVVHVVVSGYPAPTRPLPRERTWALCWSPANGVVRILGTVRAAAGQGEPRVLGPITQQSEFPRECRLVPVASMGRGKRAALERIANGVGVMRPNGWWNGQNWVVEVLKRAVEQDLISPDERDNAIYTAAEP
ncbi:hypothetical protein BJY52DRAFT_1190733 [Lactarius psammicola]|nr:hypothetical protein BJY52DRAFT_1190733 [Lactarius psammicola]